MKYTQIRNATAIVEFAGVRFLIDPVLGEQFAYPGFPGTANSKQPWPTVALPTNVSIEEMMSVDAVIITHTHEDHWDAAAISTLPKDKIIFVQHDSDRAMVMDVGFTDVRILDDNTLFNGVTLSKTSGRHGSKLTMLLLGGPLGAVSGVMFSHPDEKTTYIAGDTVWCDAVDAAIHQHKPDVLILNAGDARIPLLGCLIMNEKDVLKACQTLPNATVIATHMEAVNHASISRDELRKYIVKHGIEQRVLIPADGETVTV